MGGCLPGYSGRACICSRCATGFGRRGSECVACPATGVGGFVALMLLLLLAATLLLTRWARLATVSYQRAIAAGVTGALLAATSSPVSASEPSRTPPARQFGMGQAGAAGARQQASSAPRPSSLFTRAVPATKLLLDHAQALQASSSMQLVWPSAMVAILNRVSVASSTADTGYLVQWDCAVQAMAPVPVASLWVATQVISFLVPFLLLGAAVSVLATCATASWLCHLCNRRRVLKAAPPAADGLSATVQAAEVLGLALVPPKSFVSAYPAAPQCHIRSATKNDATPPAPSLPCLTALRL